MPQIPRQWIKETSERFCDSAYAELVVKTSIDRLKAIEACVRAGGAFAAELEAALTKSRVKVF